MRRRFLAYRLLALGLALAMASPAAATYTTYNENLPGGPSVVYGTDAVIIANGIQGNGWLGGATLEAQATPDMTVNLASGSAWSGQSGTPQVIIIDAAATLAISAADAENPRLDLISISFSSTTAVVTTGTPYPFPVIPNLPATNQIPNIALWVVVVPAGVTAITTGLLMDKRMAPVKDWTLNTADVVDNNVSTTKHGFAPKAPNDALRYLDGTGAYSQAALKTGAVAQGSVLATAITAPSTPAAGKGSIYVDSTSKNLAVKDDAGVVKHGVQTDTGAANNFLTAISDAGLVTKAQPTDANLSMSDITTNNVSTTAHGFTPKLSNVATEYLSGTGVYTAPGATAVRLGSDVATSVSATYADITGLTFTPAANKDYLIDFDLIYTSDTVTIGADFSVNGPASPTSITCRMYTQQNGVDDANGFLNAYDANSNKAVSTTASVTNYATIRCILRNAATSAAFVGRFRLETGTAAVLTVLTGSVMRYTLLN